MSRLPDKFRDRAKRYAASAIKFLAKYPKETEESKVLGRQLFRSATLVATHVREAARARSESDFVSNLSAALDEADRALLWLELLREECDVPAGLTQALEKESAGLISIFNTMIERTSQGG